MSEINWQDVLNIGLPKIDKQHKSLIALSNSLIQAMTMNRGQQALTDVFNELKAYTIYHFTDEERYMKDIGYPHREEHVLLHKILIKRVDDFRDRLLYSTVTPKETLDFINSWIVHHIAEEDCRIGTFVRNNPSLEVEE